MGNKRKMPGIPRPLQVAIHLPDPLVHRLQERWSDLPRRVLDGDHAIYKVGKRLDERGMIDLLQPGLTRASLHDYRLGHILDALFAANLNKVFSALVLKALAVYTIPIPWLHQDTTTIALYG